MLKILATLLILTSVASADMPERGTFARVSGWSYIPQEIAQSCGPTVRDQMVALLAKVKHGQWNKRVLTTNDDVNPADYVEHHATYVVGEWLYKKTLENGVWWLTVFRVFVFKDSLSYSYNWFNETGLVCSDLWMASR